jgi:hypothetical protein
LKRDAVDAQNFLDLSIGYPSPPVSGIKQDCALKWRAIHKVEVRMCTCVVLLLRATGASWVPFIAIPGVLAGFLLSVWVIVSGVAGLFSMRHRPIRSSKRTLGGNPR